MRALGIIVLLLITSPVAAQMPDTHSHTGSLAQRVAPRFRVKGDSVRAGVAAVMRRQTRAAFPIELVGGTAGSLLGLGVGLLVASPDDCNNEDLACILRRIGIVGLFSIAGAPAGTMLVGDWADTRPSLAGAAIGSLAGAAAGAGLLRLSEEIDDDPLPVLYSLIAYGGAHGLLTALGSRIGAWVRD